MKTITASEFKAKCLKIMDEVAATGERVEITKNGVPVAKLLRHRAQQPESLYGALKDSMSFLGDIEKPIDVEWDAMK